MTQSVLSYDCGWNANVMSWAPSDPSTMRIGVGSFLKQYSNSIEIIERHPDTGSLVCRARSEHSYPATKIMMAPQAMQQGDVFVTTGDYLRVWTVTPTEPKQNADGPDDTKDIEESGKESEEHTGSTPLGGMEGNDLEGEQKQQVVDQSQAAKVAEKDRHINSELSFKLLNNNKNSEFCSPLTSCDWNIEDPKMVATCSIDTTTAIWDIEKQSLTTQLIAHDKEVYDIAFAKGTSVFATCGADTSLRVFDSREMEHCTIVFESPDAKPLLRCAWNRLDGTYIATFTADGTAVYIVDVRYPSMPINTLDNNHTAPINSMMWAPHSPHQLCTAGEDKTALVWDLSRGRDERGKCEPVVDMCYQAPAEINTIGMCPNLTSDEDWIAITCGNEVQVLKC